jgi:hypothetical protein
VQSCHAFLAGKLGFGVRRMVAVSARDTGSRPRQFRWRAIPVAIIGAIGCAFFVFGLYSLSTSARPDGIDVFDDIWIMFLGSCFIASSILWRKGRWRLGIAVIAACLSFPLILFVWGVYMTMG